MTVREADTPWSKYSAAQKLVADMFEGRETALTHIRAMPGHDPKTTGELFAGGAYFLPIVARTVEALGGLVFSKAPTRTAPASLDPILENVTGTGQGIDRLAEQAFDAVLLAGVIALLVDVPPARADLTKGMAAEQGIHPTIQLYTAGAILAARYVKKGAQMRLSHVRLLEVVEEQDPQDEFKLVEIEQVRVLDLDGAGLYRQRVFRAGTGMWAKYGDDILPLMAGRRFDEIPVFFANPRDGEARPAKPVVADLADISVAHLNNSAALEWALMWTANPTPVFIGLPDGADDVKLGSSEGIGLPVDGDAKFMEFTGSGLTPLENALENKRRDGAMMGARMLLEDKSAPETAETAKINRSGETSVVGGIANALSTCFTKALTFLAKWNGSAGECKYTLQTDYNVAGLSPQMLAQLLSAWTQGALTEQELFALLQGHELIEATKTFDAHVAELPEPDSEDELDAAGNVITPPAGAPTKKPKAKAKPQSGAA